MTGEGEQAVERLRRLYARFAEGDFSADIEIYDPDIEVVWAEGMADSTVDRGVEALGATINRFMEAFRDVRFIADRMVARGDQVLVSVRGHGTGRATELPVSREIFHLWTFSGGRAVRIEGFWEEKEALDAAGIAPER